MPSATSFLSSFHKGVVHCNDFMPIALIGYSTVVASICTPPLAVNRFLYFRRSMLLSYHPRTGERPATSVGHHAGIKKEKLRHELIGEIYA